ncbi:MAG: branched-chain amino acid transport system ATP-binding protein [Solirubrobacteraceae bacterium]|jgi:branched-chain amino acid transport system ATP-binding protein|nr:branched-chain amino acid transport system ATP-binding protein [Solirubrobacteraceae bacterium]
MTAVLECQGLTAGYAGVPVVRDLDLTVEAGEVVALLGPNGAGKTTTLLTLAGVVPKISGSAQVLGSEVSGGRPHKVARRGAVLVPDDRAIFFDLTARENLRLGAGGKEDAVEIVLDYFPSLKPRMSTRAGLLSGGEQQMLAVGRALSGRPKVLMIDEMSLGLAPVIVKRMFPVVRRIADEIGAGVLVVEQHIDVALQAADRAYVLSHGEVAMKGRAAELLKDRHLLQASYMGMS